MAIIENMKSEEYFAIEAASNSGLNLVRQSPAHFKYREPDSGDTRAKQIGTAIHAAILEPDHFASYYLVAESDDRVSSFYKGLAKDAGGHRVLTRPEYRRILGMQESAYRNTRFAGYMQAGGRNELSVIAKDPVTGAQVKCRFDRKGDGNWALDLKKCQDARGSEFTKTISSYGYYMQVAFYMMAWEWETGEKMAEFPIVALEEKSPHGCILHDLDEIALELGRKHAREALDTYARCLESGVWPGYQHESEITSVTNWMANELLGDSEFGGI